MCNFWHRSRFSIIITCSIERVDFGERKEEKGFCHVRIEADEQGKKNCSHDFIKVGARPMIQVDVLLEPGVNQTQQITAALHKHNIDDAIVKITYKLPKGSPDKVDILTIQRVCKNAQYLVGIIPIHVIAAKPARVQLKIEMDVKTMLSKYFDSKEELVEQKEVLMKKALELYNEVELK